MMIIYQSLKWKLRLGDWTFGLGLGLRIVDWGSGLMSRIGNGEFRIGDWGLRIGIGDLGSGLGIQIKDWGLGVGIGMGIGIVDWEF